MQRVRVTIGIDRLRRGVQRLGGDLAAVEPERVVIDDLRAKEVGLDPLQGQDVDEARARAGHQ